MPSNPNSPGQDDPTAADSQADRANRTREREDANRGQPPEKVEDRPTVGQAKPEDYPARDRSDSKP